MHTKEAYPSSFTDQEWALIEPMVPGPSKLGRPARSTRRSVIGRRPLPCARRRLVDAAPRDRRFAKDEEYHPANSEALLLIAASKLMVARLAK